jgi:N-glycosylase/DNA lyase
MQTLATEDFSLKHTIESGQFFLFDKIDDFYYITHTNKIFKVKQEHNTLLYDNIKEKELKHFFNLNLNLKDATKDFDDEHLILALKKYWGLRLINQDLWQALIGFVCSQCSNIPKIKMNLKLICKYFGEKTIYDNHEFYTFPEPGSINDITKLKEAKTGYRAEYIYKINKLVKDTNLLETLRQSSYKDAKQLLMTLPGIGSKVADCAILYGLKKEESFPIDTWIKQVIEQLYLKGNKTSIKQIEQFINEKFPTNKGLKQQYLFHWARHNLK